MCNALTKYQTNQTLSIDRSNKVEDIIYSIIKAYGLKSVPQLAERWDYSSMAIYKWIERESIPVKNVSRVAPEINKHFLQTGDGPVFKDDHKYPEEVPREDVIREGEHLQYLFQQLSEDKSSGLSRDDAARILLNVESMIRSVRKGLSNPDDSDEKS